MNILYEKGGNKMKSVIGTILGLFVVALIYATPAYAISISLNDGINPIIVCADGGACDINTTLGAVTYSGGVGNFIINVTTGITYPVLGTATNAQIDLSSVNVSSSGGGTLTILVSETGYSGPTLFTTAVGGVTTGTLALESFLDASNTLFGTASPIGTLGTFSGGAFAGTTSGGASATAPFSLTMGTTITHWSGTNSTSFNASLNANSVPEPASLLLLGSGLLGLAFWGRKRFRNTED